ncbi:DUF1257 domain-containing protein [Gloeobacter violaceus]|uniref:Ycf35 protein n=1 Tax=Gloeobacter violaceus (strain ATCC 29082 / PCC 7421) TaxID=251221 RepID=Q7NES3_GLOVI|nr:DUF1257 domain-containing protein [Gloeobacter violaceus]BAC91746.1 ycf35 [Gloeobacter violaceus PCC 7421]
MSHFTTVRLELKNRAVLKATLEQLGFTVALDAAVRGYKGETTRADLVVRRPGGYDIGFRRVGDHLEMVADFWGVGSSAERLLAPIRQRYARNVLIETAAAQGFTVESEQVGEAGEVRVVIARWA